MHVTFEDQMSELAEIEKKLEEFTKTHHLLPKHTDFQIEHFMIGKETGKNGKIWQCIRELNARKDNLEALNLEIEQTKDNLELAKIKCEIYKIKKTFNKNFQLENLNKRKKDILIRKQDRLITNIENSLHKLHERKQSILLECKKIIEVFNQHNPQNKVIDIDDKDNQLEYWNNKLLEEINLNAMLGMPVGLEIVKSVLALPENSQVKVQLVNAMVNNGKKLLE